MFPERHPPLPRIDYPHDNAYPDAKVSTQHTKVSGQPVQDTIIPTAAEAARLYNFEQVALADFCTRHGIPTGEPIPAAAHDLVQRAGVLTGRVALVIALTPKGAALLAEARALIARSRTQEAA